jgi:hypothetical protein
MRRILRRNSNSPRPFPSEQPERRIQMQTPSSAVACKDWFWMAMNATALVLHKWVDVNNDYEFSLIKESEKMNETD